jgi:hypothetical protein
MLNICDGRRHDYHVHLKSALSTLLLHNEGQLIGYVDARLWPNGPVCHHC